MALDDFEDIVRALQRFAEDFVGLLGGGVALGSQQLGAVQLRSEQSPIEFGDRIPELATA